MCTREGLEVGDMAAGGADIVTYKCEIGYVGKEARGHFGDSRPSGPWCAAIDDDAAIR